MEFSTVFFRDEIRNGFYIPTVIKQAWAATLSVLSEIDRICEKYDITYYADWGTVLGAVRHGGFVPWDDDLDICMMRDDYEKFREVADEELPEEFTIHDYERHQNHWLFLTRVVNNSRMCFEEEYLRKNNNFPWLAGVDIFVKDYLFSDDEEEIHRDKDILSILAIADAIRNGDLNTQSAETHLEEIQMKYRISLPKTHSGRDIAVALYRLAEKQMSKVKPDESKKIGQIFPWIIRNGPSSGEDKRLYDKIIRLPFENTTIPVPAYYDKVLKKRYGNYCQIRKACAGHDYPFFEAQKAEMERLIGQKISSFKFDKSMLSCPAPDRSACLKTTARNCVEELKSMLKEALDAALRNDYSDASGLLSDIQQLAIDLGTLIEAVKGEDNSYAAEVVKTLELFCECVWQDDQSIRNGVDTDFKCSFDALNKVDGAIIENIEQIKEILFLPIGPKEWNGFKNAYEELLKYENTEVWVVPLPLLKKDYFGNVILADDEIELAVNKKDYPAELILTDWNKYDIILHHPDRVYIQNLYDEVNPCLTIPKNYYTKNIREYTDEIVFMPFAKTEEFGLGDVNDIYNLRQYLATPGVFYADKLIVQSENIKEHYLNCLMDIAGKDTKEYWQEKIVIDTTEFSKDREKSEKKIMYCIGVNELMDQTVEFAQKVREHIKIALGKKDCVKVSVYYYPPDKSSWQQMGKEISREVFQAVETEGVEIVSATPADADRVAEEFDAYYGSPSPFVPAFEIQHKPVMLANYDV